MSRWKQGLAVRPDAPTMAVADVLLSLALPVLILFHLLIAPYTKVEESFNIQAVHDIVSLPLSSVASPSAISAENFDHILFPGAVPRTFVGAGTLALLSKPIIWLLGLQNEVFWPQIIVRGILGLLNAGALIRYQHGLTKAFGKHVGTWWVLLLGSQFHVIFYASRTLPNTFAFILTTLAFREGLPLPELPRTRQRRVIYLFVLAGVIFRAEIAILIFSQLMYRLVQSAIDLRTVIKFGLQSAALALIITVSIDSFFWQKLVWPELDGFIFNAIHGKSAEWGTSPYRHYFTGVLPRLLQNPLVSLLYIPLTQQFPSTRFSSRDLVVPSVLFIAIYSFQAHKESRFIIYVVPPLTAAAALSASYIWTRRSKTRLYRLGSLLLVLSIIGSFAASTIILLISSLNYPGGEALSQLHEYLHTHADELHVYNANDIRIHMDVLSCMTGVTRFQQYHSFAEDQSRGIKPGSQSTKDKKQIRIMYDKTENENTLLLPAFWPQFDYALMEDPGKAIGAWEVIGTVYAYVGTELLRPEYFGGWADMVENSGIVDEVEEVYAANNSTNELNRVPTSKEVRKAIDEHVFQQGGQKIRNLTELKQRIMTQELSRFGIYNLVRDSIRSVTGGYWLGPKMEPKIRILKRNKDNDGLVA